MRRYRNAIAHGFDVSGFNDEKVTELIEVVVRLLDSEPEVGLKPGARRFGAA